MFALNHLYSSLYLCCIKQYKHFKKKLFLKIFNKMEKYNIELSEEKEDTQFICSMINRL